jgi:hypothetical protein
MGRGEFRGRASGRGGLQAVLEKEETRSDRKRTKPEFNKAAEVFKDDPRVELAAVDCTRHSPLCSAYEVRGYPTIKYFSYLKTVKDYSGGRLEADLVKFLKNPTPSPATRLQPNSSLSEVSTGSTNCSC